MSAPDTSPSTINGSHPPSITRISPGQQASSRQGHNLSNIVTSVLKIRSTVRWLTRQCWWGEIGASDGLSWEGGAHSGTQHKTREHYLAQSTCTFRYDICAFFQAFRTRPMGGSSSTHLFNCNKVAREYLVMLWPPGSEQRLPVWWDGTQSTPTDVKIDLNDQWCWGKVHSRRSECRKEYWGRRKSRLCRQALAFGAQRWAQRGLDKATGALYGQVAENEGLRGL